MNRVQARQVGILVSILLYACGCGTVSPPRKSGKMLVSNEPQSAGNAPPIPPASGAKAAPKSELAKEEHASEAISIALGNAPSLTIRPVGPAAIEVKVADGDSTVWDRIEIERRPTTSNIRQHDEFTQVLPALWRYPPSRRHLHAASAGTSYLYRARTSGAWSREVMVRTANPHRAPTAPSAFSATPVTPFAVRLRWEADVSAVAGFEIELERDGEPVRVALVDPNAIEFEHHYRVPGTSQAYRLRIFNGHGASPWKSTLTRMPEAWPSTEAVTQPLPACSHLPPAINPVHGSPRELLSAPGTPLLYNDPEPSNSFRRHLFGEYLGCLRDFGQFDLQGQTMTPVPGLFDEGFPLLRAVEGASLYAGAQVVTLQFVRGRYVVVDEAQFCGEPSPEQKPDDPRRGNDGSDVAITSLAPPFETCQRDFE